MDIMGGLIQELLKNNHRIMIYETDKFWYDVGSTEKYEKLDNGLIDKLYQ
jgi:NDP-sugar pyrophosphorylase family protein